MKIEYIGYTIEPAVYGDHTDFSHRVHVIKKEGNKIVEDFIDLEGHSATREQAEKISMKKGIAYIDAGKLHF